MNLVFTEPGWEDYLYWQDRDPKILAKINALIKECSRTPFRGLGKPEPLRNNMAGWWSRRIDSEHRLVYRVEGDDLWVTQCRYHYHK